MSGATYFTTLGLASGYWQVEVEGTDKGNAAFSTSEGYFVINVMSFGLTMHLSLSRSSWSVSCRFGLRGMLDLP